MTPVTGKGGINEGYVFSEFAKWSEEDGGGYAFSPTTGFNLRDGATLSPDVSWVPRDQWDALTEDEQDTFPPICPSFVIEVRSKSDGRWAVHEKMGQWIDNGAALAWLVDPIDGKVTIYRPEQEPETLHRPESVTASEPVAGFTLQCKRLWPAD
jgi:Uma2 family endonuclease